MAKCYMCGKEYEKWVDTQEMCFACANREQRRKHQGRLYGHECIICGKHYISKASVSRTCSGKCVATLKRALHGEPSEKKNELIRQAFFAKRSTKEEALNREFTDVTVYLIHKWFWEYTTVYQPVKSPGWAIRTICSILDRSEASVIKALSEVVPEYQVQKWEELNWRKCKFGGSINVQES